MDVGLNFAKPAVDADSSSVAASRKPNDGSFSIDDFYKLFANQMKNQDMMNPVDDSQFLAQMTQMAMIEAMEKMNEMTMTSYAFEFMGKDVIVAKYDKDGAMQTKTGNVEKVTLYNGKPQVFVGGEAYDMAQVMEVNSSSKTDAVDLIGKDVILGEFDDKGAFKRDEDGNMITLQGTVEKVTLYEGKTEIYIDGKAYDHAQLVEVLGSADQSVETKTAEPEAKSAVTGAEGAADSENGNQTEDQTDPVPAPIEPQPETGQDTELVQEEQSTVN